MLALEFRQHHFARHARGQRQQHQCRRRAASQARPSAAATRRRYCSPRKARLKFPPGESRRSDGEMIVCDANGEMGCGEQYVPCTGAAA
jgi:hypothetical protein